MAHHPPFSSTTQYLQARVLTASQPELQLMLLDGAVRFATLARNAWQTAGSLDGATAHLTRAMEIVEELIRAVGAGESDLAKKLEDEYAFIYRSLAACRSDESVSDLTRIIGLLSFQRETWKLACDRLRQDAPPAAVGSQVAAPSSPPAVLARLTSTPGLGDSSAGSFSFTA